MKNAIYRLQRIDVAATKDCFGQHFYFISKIVILGVNRPVNLLTYDLVHKHHDSVIENIENVIIH